MAAEITQDLEDQLAETKAALQGQAEEMLDLLLRFEARIQARLDAAEARIAAFRASCDGVKIAPLLSSDRET